jgi:hypothetical protein
MIGHLRSSEESFRMGFRSRILHFLDGQQVLDYLFRQGSPTASLTSLSVAAGHPDAKLTASGLRQVKADRNTNHPVIMLTTADDENRSTVVGILVVPIMSSNRWIFPRHPGHRRSAVVAAERGEMAGLDEILKSLIRSLHRFRGSRSILPAENAFHRASM